MASGTYQQSGPSSPQAARAVLAEIPGQQKSFGAIPAFLSYSNGVNARLYFQARAAGVGGESITIAMTTTGTNAPLTVTTVSNAITVHLATDAAGNPASTAREVRQALNTDPTASGLISVGLGVGSDGSAYVGTLTATALANDANASTGTDGGTSVPLPRQLPIHNSYR